MGPKKKLKDEHDLVSVEFQFEKSYIKEKVGFLDETFKNEVKSSKQRKIRLLEDKKATWRLKRISLWISKGKKTKYFHKYPNHWKNINTIR